MTEPGYQLIAKIASGGMASVHLARRRGAGGFSRIVAIKLPHEWVLDDPSMAASLEREAFAASRLHHANVVSVLDVTEIDGKMAIVMEYVDGVSMSALLSPYRPELGLQRRSALRILLDACAGLQAAHEVTDPDGTAMAIIHRDVSPQNILVGRDGVARLTDFGIAKIRSVGAEPTHSGVVKGKMAYLAPEYLAGGNAVVESDQFSLAVILWEVVTGKRLFKGATDAETILRVAKGAIPKPSSIEPNAAPLDDVILRALSRDPAQRFPSMRALAAEVTSSASGLIATHDEVAALVERAGEGTLSQRRALLAEPRETAAPSSAAATAIDTAATRVTAPLESTAAAHVHTPPAEPKPAARRRYWLALVPLLGIAGVLAVILAMRRETTVKQPPGGAAVAASTSAALASAAQQGVPPQPLREDAAAAPSASPVPLRAPASRPTRPKPKQNADRAPPNPYGK